MDNKTCLISQFDAIQQIFEIYQIYLQVEPSLPNIFRVSISYYDIQYNFSL